MLRIILTFILLLPICTSGQIGTNFYFKPKIYNEQYKPYSFKRPSDFNAKLNRGIGFDFEIIFSKELNNSKKYISFGPSIGQYYFWNQQIKTFEYTFQYKEDNLVSPIALNLGFTTWDKEKLKTNGTFIFIDLKYGGAYLQNIIKAQGTTNVYINQRWSSIYSFSFGVWINRFPKYFPILKFGLQYTNLDGRHLNGLYFF